MRCLLYIKHVKAYLSLFSHTYCNVIELKVWFMFYYYVAGFSFITIKVAPFVFVSLLRQICYINGSLLYILNSALLNVFSVLCL